MILNSILHPALASDWLGIGFGIAVIIMLIIDLGVFNKNPHQVSNKEAIIWSFVWIAIALLFSWFVYHYMGRDAFSDYLSAYLIEKALSMDNLFVFILIFSFFAVPAQYHHKVLFYGIVGAIATRALFIFSGVWLIELSYLPPFELFGTEVRINALLTVFGVFLIIAGIKSLTGGEGSDKDLSKNFIVRLFKKFIPVTDTYHGGKFLHREKNGKLFATPLLLVVAVIEGTDVLFAVDSIPAIFAITKDPFILYTSNIFAILGLRALYFVLANFIPMFRFLKIGLGFILAFIGVKMLLADFFHVPSPVSLSIVASILLLSVLASLVIKPKEVEKK